ncbi:MAG: hypothetical protein WBZ36_14865 [Candidatus Nitrosopolaris sp.]
MIARGLSNFIRLRRTQDVLSFLHPVDTNPWSVSKENQSIGFETIGLNGLPSIKHFLHPVEIYPYGVTVYKAKNGYQKYPVPSPAKDSVSGVLGRGILF